MGYPRKTCEKLVMAADEDGNISFAQIRKVFPNHDSSFFYDLIGDDFVRTFPMGMDTRTLNKYRYETVMLFWETRPNDYVRGYEFKDSDQFRLSVSGLNIRDDCLERMKDRRLAITAAVAGIIAAIASVIALLR